MLQVAKINYFNEAFERGDILGHVQRMIPYWNKRSRPTLAGLSPDFRAEIRSPPQHPSAEAT
jgi:hypothetical protein